MLYPLLISHRLNHLTCQCIWVPIIEDDCIERSAPGQWITLPLIVGLKLNERSVVRLSCEECGACQDQHPRRRRNHHSQILRSFRRSPRSHFAFCFRLHCALNGQWKFQIATPQQSDGHTAEGNLDWLLPLMMGIPAWRMM